MHFYTSCYVSSRMLQTPAFYLLCTASSTTSVTRLCDIKWQSYQYIVCFKECVIKRSWSDLIRCSEVWLEGVWETTNTLSRKSRSAGWSFNTGRPDYEAYVIFTLLWFISSVTVRELVKGLFRNWEVTDWGQARVLAVFGSVWSNKLM